MKFFEALYLSPLHSFTEKVKERDFSQSSFFFKKDMDVFLYFHSPGTELWLTYYTFPFSVTSERLYLSQDKSMSGADIHISKSTTHQLVHSSLTKCRNYTITQWTSCLKLEFETKFQQKLDCKLSYFHYLNLPNLTYCNVKNDLGRGMKIYRKAAEIIWSHWNGSSHHEICPIPCINPKFRTYITSIPMNTGLLDDTKFAQVMLYYDTLEVQENVEYFVYGGDRLVSAVGGVIGLSLGFSFLSMLLCLIDSIQMRIVHD